jgi:hypothetical protein
MSERIDDGHPTRVYLSTEGSAIVIEMYEKEVTPPGVSGGGANETTTMRNTLWRTNAPKQLITLTPCTFIGAYDPAVYDEIVSNVNTNQDITIVFPDGSTLVFWGWIDEFIPGPIVEGVQPTAEITIIPSNQDGDGAEIAPVYSD